jgi:2-polyprenyl-6-methoxyphenol hydroxylase-like FAD-dependent oxidoreductase
MTGHAVVIAGGGPAGLMLAGELALGGADVAIVERRASQALESERSRGLHARTIEVLDQRGIAGRFLAAGTVAQVASFASIRLDISDFPTRHPYGLALGQDRFEEILADWVEELKVPVYRGTEVTGFAQDDGGVDVELSGGRSLRAEYLVGCDGGRSLIRKTAGIAFPGWDPSISYLIGEVDMDQEPEQGIRRDAKGIHALGRLPDGRVGVVVREEHVGRTGTPTLSDLSQALTGVRGTDYGLRGATWISRFNDATRQAASYREGRVLLAGDAAHIHLPTGGQGLQLGVQDAVNLGWKLAQVIRGASPESLLDTYQAERHPVAARVLRTNMAQTPLTRSDARLDALRDSVSELLSMDEPRRRFGAMMSGLDIRYDLGEGHPLLGRRMPDLDLVTADGPMRVFTLLHKARPVLLNLGEPGGFDITPWGDRVRLVDAEYAGRWELPVLGAVTAPDAVLIRPDGYVAWAGDPAQPGLPDALTTWFGMGPVG